MAGTTELSTSARSRRSSPWVLNGAKLAVSALVIALVARNVDLHETWLQICSQTLWSVFAAVLIIVVQIVAGGLRWHAILARIGASIAAARAVGLFYISVFFNSFAGSLGGDVARTLLANRAEANLKAVVTSVIVDRVATIAALALLVLLTLPMFIQRAGYAAALVPAAVAAASIAGIVLVAQLHRFPLAWQRHQLLRGLRTLLEAMRGIFLAPAAAFRVIAWAVLAQASLALSAYVIARGLDIPLALLDCMVLMQPVALAVALPISIGGWGVREAAMVGAFGLVGLEPSSALAISVQLGLLSLVATLPGGVLFLLLRGPASAMGATVN